MIRVINAWREILDEELPVLVSTVSFFEKKSIND